VPEKGELLTDQHLLLQLALVTRDQPKSREQGGRTYLHKDLPPLVHGRHHHPQPLVEHMLDYIGLFSVQLQFNTNLETCAPSTMSCSVGYTII